MSDLLTRIPSGPIDFKGVLTTLEALTEALQTNTNPDAFTMVYASTQHLLSVAPKVGSGNAKRIVDENNQAIHNLGNRHSVLMCQHHMKKLCDANPDAHFHEALRNRANTPVYLRADGATDHVSAPYDPWLDWTVICDIACPDLPGVDHLAVAFSDAAGVRYTATNAMAISSRRVLEGKIAGCAPTTYPALYAQLGIT